MSPLTLTQSESLPGESPSLITAEDELVQPGPTRDSIPALVPGYRIQHLECAGADHVEGAVDHPQPVGLTRPDRGPPLQEEGLCLVTPAQTCEA